MGKKSKYPSYSTGTVNINGQTKATTYKKVFRDNWKAWVWVNNTN